MTKEELREHCERQIRHCEIFAHDRGIEPDGNIYEEHKLILELLEQESPLDKIRAEIEAQEKWLAEAGYNAYNVSVAFGAIKHALVKLGQDTTRKSTRLERC